MKSEMVPLSMSGRGIDGGGGATGVVKLKMVSSCASD